MMKESVVYLQQQTSAILKLFLCLLSKMAVLEEKPFIAVIQTPWQQQFHQSRERTAPCFVDATGQTNVYGFAFYALLQKVCCAHIFLSL